MNSNNHPFNFDIHFGFGIQSVFVDVRNDVSTVPPPPTPGFFLTLDGDPMLLLDDEKMALL